MKFNKMILCLITLAVSVNTCGLSALAAKEIPNSDLYMADYSGALKPMTEDEIRLKEETSVLATDAFLNDLALERINEQLKEDGMDEVSYDTAELGEEIVTTDNDIMLFSIPDTQSLISFLDKVDNSTDERTSKYLPPYSKQGKFGSCGAFASTYYQMTYMRAIAKKEKIKDDLSNVLSPKFTYNIGKKADNGEAGMWPSTAYAIVQKHGCPFNKYFEYHYYDDLDKAPTNEYREWPTKAEMWKDALQNKVKQSGWGKIGATNDATPVKSPSDENLNLIKTFLANGYILNIVTPTGWITDTSTNGEKVCVEVTSDEEFHAMTVVGYDDNFSYKVDNVEGKGAFKLIDSQDDEPNEVWFAYDALNAKSALVPEKERYQGWKYNEFTWVTMYENYSPKLLAEFEITTDNRGAVDLSLGYGDMSSDKPTEQWKPFIFNETKYIDKEGGNNCFNISGVHEDNEDDEDNSATIVLDFTDLINEKETDRLDEELKWYLSSNADISEFKLIDMRPEEQDYYTSSGTLPNDTGVISVPFQLPTKVDKDKVWNISVNYPLDAKTVNASTVAVKDDSGENMLAPVLLNNDTEIVVKPRSYIGGKYYSLEIDGIKTVAGNGLNRPITKYFLVAPDKENEVDYSIESSFNDNNFLNIIRELVQKPKGVVYLSDVRDIKELDVSNSEITSLSGIEYFTSLEKLICSNNQITKLDLSKNVNLKTLDASNNLLKEIDLSHNMLLIEVNLDGNECASPVISEFKINNGYKNYTNNYGDFMYGCNGRGKVFDLLTGESPRVEFHGSDFLVYMDLKNNKFVDRVIIEMHRNDKNKQIEGKRVELTSAGDGIFIGNGNIARGAEWSTMESRKGTIEVFYTKKDDALNEEIPLGEYSAYFIID